MNKTQEEFAGLSRKELIRTLESLGFTIRTDRGKGGHYLAELPTSKAKNNSTKGDARNGNFITISSKTYNVINKKIYKQLRAYGFSEEDIDDAMG